MKQDVSSGSQSSDADSSATPENLSPAPTPPSSGEMVPEASTARALQPATPQQPQPKPSLKLRPQAPDTPEAPAPAPLSTPEPAAAAESIPPATPEPAQKPELPPGLPPLEPLSTTNPGLQTPQALQTTPPLPELPTASSAPAATPLSPVAETPAAPASAQQPSPVETSSPQAQTAGTAPRFEIRKGPPRESVAKGVTLPPMSQSRPQVPGNPTSSAPPHPPAFSGLPDKPAQPFGGSPSRAGFNPDVSTDPAAQALDQTLNPEAAATAPPPGPRAGLRVRKGATAPPPFVSEDAAPAGAAAERSGTKASLILLLILLLLLAGAGAMFFYGVDAVMEGDFLKDVAGDSDPGDRGPETRDIDGTEAEDPFAAVSNPVLAAQQQVRNNAAATERTIEVNRILRSGSTPAQPRPLTPSNGNKSPSVAAAEPTTPAPPPAPIKKLKPQPEVVHYLRSLHITGVFMTGSGSAKMMVDGQVFLLGQTINPDLELRWVDYRKEDGRLIFQDSEGMGYVKKF
ncbi:MAG: hypothetical protein ACFB20_08515 [Opitutales bacterium]